MPKSLDLDRLKKFEPTAPTSTPDPLPMDHGSAPMRWPSREATVDGQLSIKGPLHTITRFKKLCKDDRRTYADMLDILMNHFENTQ